MERIDTDEFQNFNSNARYDEQLDEFSDMGEEQDDEAKTNIV